MVARIGPEGVDQEQGLLAMVAATSTVCAVIDLRAGTIVASRALAADLGWRADFTPRPLASVGIAGLEWPADPQAADTSSSPVTKQADTDQAPARDLALACTLRVGHRADARPGQVTPLGMARRPPVHLLWEPSDTLAPATPVPGADPETSQGEPESAVDAQVLGKFTLDLDHRTVTVDDRARRILDLGPLDDNTLSYDAFFDRYHPDDRDQGLKNTRTDGPGAANRVVRMVRLRTRDGRYRPVRLSSAAAAWNASNRPTILKGTLLDLSTRQCNEVLLQAASSEAESARTAERQLRDQIAASSKASNIGLWNTVPETGECWFNEVCYTMLGYEPDAFDASFAAFRDLIHPEDRPRNRAAVDDLIGHQVTRFEVEIRLRTATGDWLWVTNSGGCIDRAHLGLPPQICGTLTDATRQRETRAKLADAAAHARTATARLSRIADYFPGGLFEYRLTASGSWRLIYSSEGTADLLGVDATQVMRHPTAAFIHIHRADLGHLRSDSIAAMRSGDTLHSRLRVNDPETGRRWIAVRARALPDDEGGTIWYGGITDITIDMERQQELVHLRTKAEEASSRLTLIADNLPGAVFEFHRATDGKMSIPYHSKGMTSLFGISADAMAANNLAPLDRIHPDDLTRLMDEMNTPTDQRNWSTNFRIDHPRMGLRWLNVQATPQALVDGACKSYGIVSDVTDDLAHETALRDARAAAERERSRVDLIADNIPGGIFELQQALDEAPRFVYASRGLCTLFNRTRDQILDDAFDLFALMPDTVAEQTREALRHSARSLQEWAFRFPITAGTDAGAKRWLVGSASPRTGPEGQLTWYGRITDETQQVNRETELRSARAMAEAANDEAEHQALHDALTELPNRRYFDRVLADRLDQAGHEDQDLSLVRIDLDHFKNVNDTLGHAAGDAVLIHVASQIQAAAAPGDFYARLGGDEFVIIMALGATELDTNNRVADLQNRLRKPFLFDGKPCRFGASFGIATSAMVDGDAGSLLSFADAALYRAKERGRNRVEVFTREFHEDILVNRHLADEIQAGLERGEFIPHYQPQIRTSDFSPAGVEVLARWQHPTRGLLAPDAFLDVADQMRLVPDIDRIMFESATSDVYEWEEQGIFVPKVAFNLSLASIRDLDIASAQAAFAPLNAQLAFELVESILIEDETASFSMNIDAIKEAGIELEVDDFGSGHASIVGLMHVGPDALKIDQRLIRPLTLQPHARKLVSAIIEIGEALDMRIIAEGVETMEEAQILRDLGCDSLQGYAFSRPLSYAALVDFMRHAARKPRSAG